MTRLGGEATMHRILIVEDTPAEADALVACLERYGSERGVSFRVERLSSALDFMERRPSADLIFMDIDMPGVTGMEAAELLRTYDAETPLVFVTNLAQYAVHGYAVDALDFIVKPVSYQDFVPHMDRAMRAMARTAGRTVAIPTGEGTRVVRVSDVLYVDILRHDIYYHLAGEPESVRVRGSIKAAEAALGQDFVRIAASCLVNMGQIRMVRRESVVMANGDELFFSRAKRREALEAINNYAGGSF